MVYLVAALMAAACVTSAEAQGRRGAQGGRGGLQGGPGARGGFRPGGFGMMGGMNELTLLQRPDVRKELELLDDQVASLQEIDVRGAMGNVFEGIRDMDPEERREKMQEAMESAQKKIRAEVDAILLPHQATRLNELAFQFSMRSPMGLTGGTVADQLGLSDAERESLREKARELQAEMQKKLLADLIKELPAAKQAKIKQLMGKTFTFEDVPRDRGPGAPDARGGFGGRRRGN